MHIRAVSNGGTAEVSDEYAERLIAGGEWVALDAPVKKRRIRRTREQIAADNAAAAAAAEAK